MDAQLAALAGEAWRQHGAFTSSPWLVRPSMPILYFGDLEAYQSQPTPRVITVALNPSRTEFPAPAPFSRFPSGIDSATDLPRYVTSLNSYFHEEPYRSWFGSYEEALLGLGTSYYSAALHTDVGSCLPTDPTWSGLDYESRSSLSSFGVPLWHELALYLRPDIVLWSTAWDWLGLIDFPAAEEWKILATIGQTEAGLTRLRPVEIRTRWYQLGEKTTLFAYVPAAQKPMGRLSHGQKRALGRLLRQEWERDGR